MTDTSEGPCAQIRLPYFYIREDFMKVLKKFAAYYKPYKKIFYLDLLCAAIISAVDLIYPQILRSPAVRNPSTGSWDCFLPPFWGSTFCRRSANITSPTRDT